MVDVSVGSPQLRGLLRMVAFVILIISVGGSTTTANLAATTPIRPPIAAEDLQTMINLVRGNPKILVPHI